MPATRRPISTGCGSSGCWREKASRRWVSDSRAPRAAHGIVGRAFQALDVGRGLAQMALQGVEIADDDGQQVVEVVRDAAGELADALHLLGLPQLLLGGPPLGQVARDLGKADQLALAVVNRIDHHARPEPAAVLADPPTLGLDTCRSWPPSASARVGTPSARSSSV